MKSPPCSAVPKSVNRVFVSVIEEHLHKGRTRGPKHPRRSFWFCFSFSAPGSDENCGGRLGDYGEKLLKCSMPEVHKPAMMRSEDRRLGSPFGPRFRIRT